MDAEPGPRALAPTATIQKKCPGLVSPKLGAAGRTTALVSPS